MTVEKSALKCVYPSVRAEPIFHLQPAHDIFPDDAHADFPEQTLAL